jgi:hypothetical protein
LIAAPKGANFLLFIRAYWPDETVLNGQWTPPAVKAAAAASAGL